MPGELQPLAGNFKITNPDGTPTDYFIRWAQQRQIDIVDSIGGERQVIAGVGLDGGGSLTSDVTLDLADTAVAPGTYGAADQLAAFTVDQQGRLIAADEFQLIPIPPGGTTGQVLGKLSDTDYDIGWIDQTGGGGGTVTSTIWRLYCTNPSQANGWYVAAREIEMRGVTGGPDQCTGGTASASSDFGGIYAASAAFDNNPSSFWLSNNTPSPTWITYTFPAVVTVEEIYWQVEAAISGPTTVSVQYWDGTAFVEYWNFVSAFWSNDAAQVFTKP